MVRELADERVRYRFGPLEQRGLIAGWRGGQIISVAGGLVIAMLSIRSHPTVGGVILALGFVSIGTASACWPIRGRTGEQWLPIAARWVADGLGGGRRRLSDASSLGSQRPVSGGRHRQPTGGRSRRPTGVFEGLRLMATPADADHGWTAAGAVIDARARTITGVLALRGHDFALLGPDEQDRRIASWSRVLSSLAREGSDVHRLQWIESCLPDDGDAVRDHVRRHAVLGPETEPGRSYASLVDSSTPVTRRHRVLVPLTVHTGHSARTIRASGGGHAGASAVLLRELVALQRQLEAADVTVDGVLGPGALASVFREAGSALSDLAAPPGPSPRGAGRPLAQPVEPSTAWPWPMATEPTWDAVRTDGTWHTTYWIAEWPRVEVTPDFLGPLLFSPVRRTMAVTMEPVSPSRAARQVAHARTSDLADGELRRRGGFLVTARHKREREGVEQRDVELTDGHAQYRFSGYVTVTGASKDQLHEARAQIEQAAGQARVDLRLLYGEQDRALTCTLPLGRGLS
ncbi:MAG TPA: SCO6880 family protein [Acidimicrobiales bacterium]